MIIKLRITLVACLVLATVNLIAQEREVDHHRQYWLSYIGTIKIDDKWSVNPDFSYRWINEFQERFQFVARAGLTRKLSAHWSVSAGYCYFFHYSNSHTSKVGRHEQRPWEQIIFQTTFKRFLIQSRFRAEQRYFQAEGEEEWKFNHRLRYQLGFQLPLIGSKLGKGVPYLQVTDEVMFNLGKEIEYNHFDQNRLNIGFGYGLTEHFSVYAGYQHGWQKRNVPNSFFNANTVKLSLIHQFSLKDK